MPVRHARSETRGRPPFGRRGGVGKNGSTRSHNGSGSSAAAIPIHATSPTRIRFRRFCYTLLGLHADVGADFWPGPQVGLRRSLREAGVSHEGGQCEACGRTHPAAAPSRRASTATGETPGRGRPRSLRSGSAPSAVGIRHVRLTSTRSSAPSPDRDPRDIVGVPDTSTEHGPHQSLGTAVIRSLPAGGDLQTAAGSGPRRNSRSHARSDAE
ncbi:MAG: hypothetical protein K0S99_1930 [Thermomicrobiales bacterium]|nr:hypothetical protein [Thermomicrobiales bacterium]